MVRSLFFLLLTVEYLGTLPSAIAFLQQATFYERHSHSSVHNKIGFGSNGRPEIVVPVRKNRNDGCRNQGFLALSSSSSSSGRTPLATEGDWSAYLDEKETGLVYYFNARTGQSSWNPPTTTFPQVKLTGSVRRRAREVRDEYVKSVEDKVQEQNKKQQEAQQGRGFFGESGGASSNIDMTDTATEKTNGDTSSQTFSPNGKNSWFRSLVDEDLVRLSPPNEESKQPKADSDEGSWLSNLFGSKDSAVPSNANSSGNKKEEKPESSMSNIFGSLLSLGQQIGEDVTATISNSASSLTTPPIQTTSSPNGVSNTRNGSGSSDGSIDQGTNGANGQGKQLAVPVSSYVYDTSKPAKLSMASCIFPHPDKVLWGGEDAVFIKGRTFGVFDGVSGASKLSGIPLYSRVLATQMKDNVGKASLSVREMVDKLTDATMIANDIATGASTAIIGSVSESGTLRLLNVGDSACIVIRNGRVAAKSKEINHYFDCPYQLSDSSPDKPRDGTRMNVDLMRGDVIVMASDGVFDNLEDREVVDVIVASGPNSSVSCSTLARRVSDASRRVSQNKMVATPYSRMAQRNGASAYENGLGGKVDDISCIVVRYG